MSKVDKLAKELLKAEKMQKQLTRAYAELKVSAIDAAEQAGVSDYGINAGIEHITNAETSHSDAVKHTREFHNVAKKTAEEYRWLK